MGKVMSKLLMVKKLKRQFFFSKKFSLVAVTALFFQLSTTSMCFGQSSSDYHPGEGIKFHDITGGSSSASSSPPVNSGSNSSSPTSPAPAASSPSSTSASVNSSATTGSSSGASTDAAAAGSETGEKGFGSFLKNVVRAGAQVGNLQQSNYGSGQSYSNYGNSSQNYARPNQGGYSNFGVHPTYNNSRPDAVHSGNPFPGRQSAYDGQQNQVPFSGNPMDLVTNNPPGPIDGDLENLIPKEIHTKAYGIELHRNGPLNGAEDNTHLF